ncbi:DUF4150 domain-containing protein [Marinomonas rhodophyticola]|uniref:DUF4150 domain-containing protein n=1 Tax=Marinomonas rhodophyticola TaxID=2992803 RepID=A0ABT3KD66_9GAMM|nr:DUF4150 domain-containing protein [Marinomonas sp. KJ51-3]MCW4628479.1 DUF4150 domain-containing protein [Marinomonas sp. KJ51-3]
MFANTQMPAMNFAFPDVCKTIVGLAVVPIPYPNISMTTMAIPNVPNIFIMAMPNHNLMTMVPMSNGDEAGIAMGVVSSLIMDPTRHLFGSVKVFTSIMPATKMLSPTGQNGMVPNAVGMTLTPCQPKVLIMS